MFEHNVEIETVPEKHATMIPEPFVVRSVHRETQDTFTLVLEPNERGRSCSFAPGQFNMVYVYGVGEVPISICGNPSDTGKFVHTARAVGTVTKAMKKLKRGDTVGIRGPFGSSWPLEEAKGGDVIIVAGGIGLPPLRPTIYSILGNRDKFGKVFLMYGTRTPADILFREELERWRAQFDLEVFITVDRAAKGWNGNVGVVTTLIPKAVFDPHNAVTMIVGPEVMMRFTISELLKRGIDPAHLYLSMERNMKCGIGMCGHCQVGPVFICKDGPVFPYNAIKDLLLKREI
jgi:NAD(P)H-flavin reductase